MNAAPGFDRNGLRQAAANLAQRGVFIGTSSWKYPGWRGLLYEEDRYVWRGRFAETRFNRQCLTEYAEVFKTVCVDGAYYKFPDRRYLQGLVEQVPEDFLFTFKVTDEITIKNFSNLPRFGPRAGQPNPNFLNADLFTGAFLQPCAEFQRNVGLLIFEFSHFYPADFARGRDFCEALDGFLTQLPKGWRYGVEIRNRTFLRPEYFETLARHGVAHVFNSWSDMPPVSEQSSMPESWTARDFSGARFLLKPGRNYQEAVDLFGPYDKLKEANEDARAAAAALITHALVESGRRLFIYVNNRLEGNALYTIKAVLEKLGEIKAPAVQPNPGS